MDLNKLTLKSQEALSAAASRRDSSARDHFKPEFLNRVDEIIVFHRLGSEHLQQIVDIQVQRLIDRLAERDILLVLTEGARRYLADKGDDPAYGARPLKRLIQREIENELALRLVNGTFRDGDTVEVDAAGDALRLKSHR